MGLFSSLGISPDSIMNASSLIGGGGGDGGDDPIDALRRKRQEDQDRQDQIKKLLAAMGAGQTPFGGSGGLMNFFGG